MTGMRVSSEEINCRRFVSAWERFAAKNDLAEIDYERSVLVQQYHFIATDFLRLAKDKSEFPEWQQLARALSAIVTNLDHCAKKDSLHEAGDKQLLQQQQEEQHVEQQAQDQAPSEPAPSIVASSPPSNTCRSPPKNSPSLMILRPEDFDTMMELSIGGNEPSSKLSAHTLRKRLGLVDRSIQERQASASTLTAVKSREEQESLQNDMMQLAQQLKVRTQSINSSLQQDAKVLEQVGQKAESNQALLQREQQALEHQLATAIGFWTSLWLVLVVLIAFILMYLYIKVFGKRFG